MAARKFCSVGVMLGACLDAAPVLVNMSCHCCIVAGGGGLAGGSLGAGLGGTSWIACVARVPVGGDVPRSWEPCSTATNW